MKLPSSAQLFYPVVLGALSLFAVVFYYVATRGDYRVDPPRSDTSIPPLAPDGTATVATRTEDVIQVGSVAPLKEYRNEIFGIAFTHPDNLIVSELRDGICLHSRAEPVEDEGGSRCLTIRPLKEGETFTSYTDVYKEQNLPSKTMLETLTGGKKTRQFPAQHRSFPIFIDLGTSILTGNGAVFTKEILDSMVFIPTTITPYTVEVKWGERSLVNESKEKLSARACVDGEGYKVGTVKNGTFAGESLIARARGYCGMWCGGRLQAELNYYVAHGGFDVPVGEGTPFILPYPESPSEIAIPNTKYKLKKDFTGGFFPEENADNKSKVLFRDAQAGAVYMHNANECIAIRRVDHAMVNY